VNGTDPPARLDSASTGSTGCLFPLVLGQAAPMEELDENVRLPGNLKKGGACIAPEVRFVRAIRGKYNFPKKFFRNLLTR